MPLAFLLDDRKLDLFSLHLILLPAYVELSSAFLVITSQQCMKHDKMFLP